MLFFKETTTPAPTPAPTPAATYQPDICKTLGHGMKQKCVILIINLKFQGHQ